MELGKIKCRQDKMQALCVAPHLLVLSQLPLAPVSHELVIRLNFVQENRIVHNGTIISKTT